MMTNSVTVQKMHSFRPFLTLEPCPPFPGHRFTPIQSALCWQIAVHLQNRFDLHARLFPYRLHSHAVLLSCEFRAITLFQPGFETLAAKKCASACRQAAIRTQVTPNGHERRCRDAASPDVHALVTRIDSFGQRVTMEAYLHSRAFWQQVRQRI